MSNLSDDTLRKVSQLSLYLIAKDDEADSSRSSSRYRDKCAKPPLPRCLANVSRQSHPSELCPSYEPRSNQKKKNERF